MTEIKVPELEWEYRYRRMVDIAYTALAAGMIFIKEKYGPEAAVELYKKIQPAMSSRTAAKLIRDIEFEPTVEGALKLALVYSCEVWGYGAYEYVDAALESPARGTYVNKVCRFWEKKEDFGFSGDCSHSCVEEYGGLVGKLSPKLKVSMSKALPWGDSVCEYVIEEK